MKLQKICTVELKSKHLTPARHKRWQAIIEKELAKAAPSILDALVKHEAQKYLRGQ